MLYSPAGWLSNFDMQLRHLDLSSKCRLQGGAQDWVFLASCGPLLMLAQPDTRGEMPAAFENRGCLLSGQLCQSTCCSAWNVRHVFLTSVLVLEAVLIVLVKNPCGNRRFAEGHEAWRLL